MTLHLVPASDPVLRAVAAPVERIDDELRAKVRELQDLMRRHRGAGLAAPQAGWPVAIVVIDPGLGDSVLINPVILDSDGACWDSEGCLSLPGASCYVERAKRIRLRWQDLDGQVRTAKWNGLAARVVQHELDHLAGILMTDRAAAP